VYVCEDGKTLKSIGGPKPASRMSMDSEGRLYVVSHLGDRSGVWRFSGKTWERLFDERYAENVAVDPTNPNRIAVTTNENPYVDISPATGVWISGDRGKTWSQANEGLAMLRGHAIAFDPFDGEKLVFGSFGRGFWKTRWPKGYVPKGGRTYTMVPADMEFAAVDPWNGRPGAVLRNGSMSDGNGLPTGWDQSWTGRGKLQIARDTSVFKAGPASLRVASEGGEAHGQASQVVEAPAGTRFRLSGFVRSAGKAKVNVAVQPMTADWKPIAFVQAHYVQNNQDWVPFSREIVLPEGTERFGIVLLIEGDGQAWLDEVKLEPAN